MYLLNQQLYIQCQLLLLTIFSLLPSSFLWASVGNIQKLPRVPKISVDYRMEFLPENKKKKHIYIYIISYYIIIYILMPSLKSKLYCYFFIGFKKKPSQCQINLKRYSSDNHSRLIVKVFYLKNKHTEFRFIFFLQIQFRYLCTAEYQTSLTDKF